MCLYGPISVLYRTANEARPASGAGAEDDPQIGPQMIPSPEIVASSVIRE